MTGLQSTKPPGQAGCLALWYGAKTVLLLLWLLPAALAPDLLRVASLESLPVETRLHGQLVGAMAVRLNWLERHQQP